MRYKTAIALTVLLVVFCAGFTVWKLKLFQRQERKSPVIARVGYYAITAQDLENEFKRSRWADNDSIPVSQALQKALDSLIRSELILQEAQRMSLDKNPEFMKAIESYWKQALTTMVLKKVDADISSRINIEEADLTKFYELMKRVYMIRTIRFNNAEQAGLFTLKPHIDIQERVDDAVSDSGWEEYNYDELPLFVRSRVDSLSGDIIGSVQSETEKNSVILLKYKGEREIPSIDSLRSKIEEIIKEEQYSTEFESWLNTLKAKTDIVIEEDPDNIQKLVLNQASQSSLQE